MNGSRLAIVMLAITAGFCFPFEECDHCVPDPKKPRLCERHSAEERDALRGYKRDLKSRDVESRRITLRKVAALSHSHSNAPSVAVAKVLAGGLRDPSLAVRFEAIQLLLARQNPEVTVASLIAAIDGADSQWRKAKQLAQRIADEKVDFTVSAVQEVSAGAYYMDAVLAALGQVPDDRAVDALQSVLKRPLASTPAKYQIVACRSLLGLRQRNGVGAVLAFHDKLEKFVLAQSKKKSKQPLVLKDLLTIFFAVHTRSTQNSILQEIEQFASSEGLANFPGRGEWREWLRSNEGHFPTKLGKLEQPVHAELPDDVGWKFLRAGES